MITMATWEVSLQPSVRIMLSPLLPWLPPTLYHNSSHVGSVRCCWFVHYCWWLTVKTQFTSWVSHWGWCFGHETDSAHDCHRMAEGRWNANPEGTQRKEPDMQNKSGDPDLQMITSCAPSATGFSNFTSIQMHLTGHVSPEQYKSSMKHLSGDIWG